MTHTASPAHGTSHAPAPSAPDSAKKEKEGGGAGAARATMVEAAAEAATAAAAAAELGTCYRSDCVQVGKRTRHEQSRHIMGTDAVHGAAECRETLTDACKTMRQRFCGQARGM